MQPTVEDQIALEERMIDLGASRYKTVVKKHEEKDRGSETSYANVLTQEFLLVVSEGLQEYLNYSKGRPGKQHKYNSLLRQIDPDKAALFTLQSVFNSFMREVTLPSLAGSIGTLIEDELLISKFKEENEYRYNHAMDELKRRRTRSYGKKHQYIIQEMREHKQSVERWTTAERTKVGMRMLDILSQTTDLIERQFVKSAANRKGVTKIVATEQALEWVQEHKEYTSLLYPEKLPTIVPPLDWENSVDGGYYSPRLQLSTPLVKTRRNRKHDRLLEDTDLSYVINAVNSLQRVPWQINNDVFNVMREIWDGSRGIAMPNSEPYEIPPPPYNKESRDELTEEEKSVLDEWKSEAGMIYRKEAERKGQCFQVARIIRLASEFKDYDRFWFVYYLDFRGRIYTATSGFSPQGSDQARASIQLAEGKPLGERGAYWLKVHAANKYGNDKGSYDDRVKWVDEHREMIEAIADNPIGTSGYWAEDVDKPWQFLASCFELARMWREGVDIVSHIPVALDGSCNGLQNFSALLKDRTGGEATNLVDGEEPRDIYQQVADLCTKKLREANDEYSKAWCDMLDKNWDGKMSRKMAKRPVMVLPYGGTRNSCTQYLYESLISTDKTFFKKPFQAALHLTPFMWDSISETVRAAREAMDWIQSSVVALAKENKPALWKTPTGFPVYQSVMRLNVKQIETQLNGRLQLRVGTQTSDVNVTRQRSSAAPNYVHSLDASHLVTMVHHCKDRGIKDLAVIHDDYGTHACNIDGLHKAIRSAFVEVYKDGDVFEKLRDELQGQVDADLRDLPEYGNLDIRDVLKSRYFFG